MKLLNWAKEKLKAVGKAVYDKTHSPEQRFNKTVDSVVQPPDRKRRSETRKKARWYRWYTMPTGYGCPKLSGLRLLRTMSNCTGIPLSFVKLMAPEARIHWQKLTYEERDIRWPRKLTNIEGLETSVGNEGSVPVVRPEKPSPAL